MGVNMVGFCIDDDEVCCDASRDEIIRRYYDATNKFVSGADNGDEVRKCGCSSIRRESTPTRAVSPWLPRRRRDRCGNPCAAIELADGTIITSETSELLGPSAALILNATKHLAGIDHSVKLIPQEMIEPIQKTKTGISRRPQPAASHRRGACGSLPFSPRPTNAAGVPLRNFLNSEAVRCIPPVMLSEVDRKIFRKLGVGLTCEPVLKKHKS